MGAVFDDDTKCALDMVAAFSRWDMRKARLAWLAWLYQSEADGHTERGVEEFTRTQPAHAARAYSALQHLAEREMVTSTNRWERPARVKLTDLGRRCVESGTDPEEYMTNEQSLPQSLSIDASGGGSVVVGRGNAAAAGDGGTAIAGSGNTVQASALEADDLIALLSRVKINLPMQSASAQEQVDELIAQAQDEEDTPTLRARIWGRIASIAASAGLFDFIREKFETTFLGT
jgi:hypothetical protein